MADATDPDENDKVVPDGVGHLATSTIGNSLAPNENSDSSTLIPAPPESSPGKAGNDVPEEHEPQPPVSPSTPKDASKIRRVPSHIARTHTLCSVVYYGAVKVDAPSSSIEINRNVLRFRQHPPPSASEGVLCIPRLSGGFIHLLHPRTRIVQMSIPVKHIVYCARSARVPDCIGFTSNYHEPTRVISSDIEGPSASSSSHSISNASTGGSPDVGSASSTRNENRESSPATEVALPIVKQGSEGEGHGDTTQEGVESQGLSGDQRMAVDTVDVIAGNATPLDSTGTTASTAEEISSKDNEQGSTLSSDGQQTSDRGKRKSDIVTSSEMRQRNELAWHLFKVVGNNYIYIL